MDVRLRGESRTSDLVGKTAPQLNVTTLDDRSVSLINFRDNHNVVVAFWASWCVPCRIEIPLLKRFYEAAHKNHTDFEIVAVSIDTERASAVSYAESAKLPFPVSIDTSNRIADAWHITSIPALFVVDKTGKVTNFHLGAEPGIDLMLAAWLGINDYKPEFQVPNARRN